MPAKINMVLSNGNYIPQATRQINSASLASAPIVATKSVSSSLNAPIISRIHNVRPGCGSCGRH
jgi:hypothetical protein